MDDLRNRLSELLKKQAWTTEEKKWMLRYLEGSDTGELQDLMQQQYREDEMQVQPHPELSQQMLQELHERLATGQKKKASLITMWTLRIAVAASVLLLIGFASGWFSNSKQQKDRIVQQPKTPENGARIDPLMAVVQHEVNTSDKLKQLVLPDGSAIALYDSSELTYKEPASGNERNVYLVGKAEFTVAKNKAKPFTVFSGDISTTAVGTVFTVTAKQAGKNIRIRLDEGKVVVKPVRGYNEKWTKDVYMTPGQELTYDKSRQTVSLQPSGLVKRERTNGAKDNPSIPRYDKRSWFMFNNQSLSGVFDALAEMYDVKILYAKKDVKNMYFIGTYDKSDSLEKILTQIALLNNLKVTRSKEAFTIEKQSVKK